MATPEIAAPQEREVLNTKQLAEFLGRSTKTVQRLVAEGMPYVMVGAHRVFLRASVMEWLYNRQQRDRR